MVLQWLNPTGHAYAGVMIRRSQGSAPPSSTTAGTLVTDVAVPAQTFTDTGLRPGTQYSYSFFAHDAGRKYAAAVVGTGTTVAIAGPLRWGTPTRVDPDGGSLKSVSCATETFCRAVDIA